MSARPANVMPSEVSILKTRAAAKKALGKTVSETETVWPKPEFGPGTKIESVVGDGFVIPAGAMFPLGCAIPNHTVLQHGAYFPPGTMFPDGVLVPIHARMVSVPAISTRKLRPDQTEALCTIM